MSTTTLTLTDAQERALRTMSDGRRTVGSRSTDEVVGYVNTAAAKALVDLGLASYEKGATGRDVFTITLAGLEALDARAA